MGLSIVIPALNEQQGIARTLQEIKSALDGAIEYEIVVVDDGSTDATVREASKAATVISHGRNRGYGAAIKTGVEKSRFDTICLLDADCTYPPAGIMTLYKAYKSESDIISGSRFLGRNEGMPPIRKLGNSIFAMMASILLGRRVHDVSSGMKVFSKGAFKALAPLPDTLDMMLVITIRAIKRGYSFKEIPIEYGNRQGSSKLSAIREGARFAITIFRTGIFG
jgi:glycosyltransferase involved in cell wall biosynthesis